MLGSTGIAVCVGSWEAVGGGGSTSWMALRSTSSFSTNWLAISEETLLMCLKTGFPAFDWLGASPSITMAIIADAIKWGGSCMIAPVGMVFAARMRPFVSGLAVR